MPRLSLLVPFVRDPQALEATLLNVLEMRSSETELLIVHRGQYEDPYGLDGDEAIVIETSVNATLAEQLNVAARRATGEIVQVLLPGTLLQSEWADGALEAFEESDVDVVSLGITSHGSIQSGGFGGGDQQTVFGYDAQVLPQRKMTSDPVSIAGPLLAGTMIRRSTLLSVGGWNEKIASDLIDFELCLMTQVLNLNIGVVADVQLACQEPTAHALSPYESGKAIGMLASAYSLVEGSKLTVEPLGRRLGALATGLMNPKLAAERLGWVLGVRDRSLVRPIAERVELARARLSGSVLQAPATGRSNLPSHVPGNLPDASQRAA